MIRRFASIVLAVLLMTAPLQAAPAPPAIPAAVNEFAFGLLHALPSEGNVFVSPLSISAALTLTMHGASGPTRTEMASTLHLDEGALEPFGALLRKLGGDDMKIANAIWVAVGTQLQPAFQDSARKWFDADAVSLDFAHAAAAACQQINAWVAVHTADHIKHLLDRVDASTEIILTNAIYFHGRWRTPFVALSTAPGPFHLADGKVVDVPMMRGNVGMRVKETEVARLIVLPYDGPFDMVLLVPTRSLEDVKSMSASALLSLMDSAHPTSDSLSMPRFKLSQRLELQKTLTSMGMKLAFSPGADFSAMLSAKGARISEVVHQADVEVDEKGTTAAAATAVIMTRAMAMEVKVDRPFLFAIVHRETRTIAFLGRLTDPR